MVIINPIKSLWTIGWLAPINGYLPLVLTIAHLLVVFHGRNLQLLRHQRCGGAESQCQAVAVGRGHAQPGDGADLPGGEVAIFDGKNG